MRKPHINADQFIVVIGDVHHQLALATEGLEQIEQTTGRKIDQVFSVGDLGLFLQQEDWQFLTGPKKYREPEVSPKLRRIWKDWRWPVAAIGGNHEPYHLLRDWNPDAFEGKLAYTDAGLMEHCIQGLRVAGLSGIFHPEHLSFSAGGEFEKGRRNLPQSWPALVGLVRAGKLSPKCLTYFKESEIEALKKLSPSPHLLLLHDWPVAPGGVSELHSRRPEREIVEALQPAFVCCGHHHMPGDFHIGSSRVLALNLIHHTTDYAHQISQGWGALFSWKGTELDFLGTWPEPSQPNG